MTVNHNQNILMWSHYDGMTLKLGQSDNILATCWLEFATKTDYIT